MNWEILSFVIRRAVIGVKLSWKWLERKEGGQKAQK